MTDDKFDVYYSNGGDGGLYNLESEIKNHVTIVSNLRKMKKLREKVIQEMEKGQISTDKSRMKLFKELDAFISNWKGQYPDFGKLFPRKEMDWLLMKYVEFIEIRKVIKTNLLNFVIECGYKDKPDVDEDGKPLLNRTTPLHYAGRRTFFLENNTLHELFEIYDRFDVNYSDEDGFTHFHVACSNGCYDVVEKFLELGQDANCLLQKLVDSPLYMALYPKHLSVAELLLKNGANPNLANKHGSTPLHFICSRQCDDDLVEIFFQMCDDNNHPLQVDARNKLDQTPLHLAVYYMNKKAAKLLLKRGADPNVANTNGQTPLHFICWRKYDDDFIEQFLQLCDDSKHSLQVDARDKSGWTPLQWAVAYLRSDLVDVLLDHGSKLSNFVFPTISHFNIGFLSVLDGTVVHAKLKVVFDVRAVAKCLEKRGYKLKLQDVQTITNLFGKYGVFEKSTDLDQRWYDDDEFTSIAKKIMMNTSQSLYDLIRSPPAKAKEILPSEDYYHKLVSSCEWLKLSQKFRMASVTQLCDIIAREFLFRRRAIGSLLKLTRNKLPIFCYDMIIEPLTNKDLWFICLASPSESKRYF